ncbi:MAG: DUF456 domain-containing protein [Chloroflexi bacterium]|nr:MAG: DUF456 domain-containing protein [Chloroflexota bacterium]
MQFAGLDTLQTLTLLVMALGIVGVLVPLIPGPLIIWAVALVYDLIRGITWRSGIVLAILTVLMVAGSTTDLWLSSASARRSGASGCAIAAAAVAGLVGFVVFNVLGAVLLPALTVLVVELIRLRDLRHATRAGRGYLAGWLISTGAELLVALVMIALWLWQVGGWRAVIGL